MREGQRQVVIICPLGSTQFWPYVVVSGGVELKMSPAAREVYLFVSYFSLGVSCFYRKLMLVFLITYFPKRLGVALIMTPLSAI